MVSFYTSTERWYLSCLDLVLIPVFIYLILHYNLYVFRLYVFILFFLVGNEGFTRKRW